MELSINRQIKIRDVKKQFAALFPFLKLEFFMYRQGVGGRSVTTQKLPDNAFFPEQTVEEGKFLFAPDIPVNAFEQQLQNKLGLPAQVFRKSGNVWIKTAPTGHLSLARQNEIGKEVSKPIQFNIHTLFL